MKRYLLLIMLLAPCLLRAQLGWMAPEGKIIDYRTLAREDYLGKPEKKDKNVSSFIVPALYYMIDTYQHLPNDRIHFEIRVKCAFQSHSWIREETEEGFRHQQNQYDIALTYSNMLKAQLTTRDYSATGYQKELDAIHDNLFERSKKVHDAYQQESDRGNNKTVEQLWNMRVKKCLENNTDEYFSSPETAVQSVKAPGQLVKKMQGENAKQLATRCRPLCSWYGEDISAKTIETTDWSAERSVIAFYTRSFKDKTSLPKLKNDSKEILACAFIPAGKDTYKRVSVDTFSYDDQVTRIEAAFMANADSDVTNELVVITATTWKDEASSGTMYNTYIYDNPASRMPPSRLRSLELVAAQVNGGLDGMRGGKQVVAKFKSERDVREGLRKLGFN